MSIMLATLLSLTTSNGSVGPAHQISRTCDINAAQVRMYTTCPMCMVAPPLTKKIKFNSEVPNVHVLESLIVDANNVSLPRPMPMGSSMTEYAAYLPNTHKKVGLRLSAGKQLVYQNNSRSGQKLIRFLNLNCK